MGAVAIGLLSASAAFPQARLDPELEATIERLHRDGPLEVEEQFEALLQRFRGAGDRVNEAAALGQVGLCRLYRGDPTAARDRLEEALRIQVEVDDRAGAGKTLSHLGLVAWEVGDYGAAQQHFDRALALAREVRDPKLEGSVLNNLGLVLDELGEYRRSLERYEAALDAYTGVGFPRGEGDTLGNIGGVHLLLGEYRQAMEYYERAREISEREGLLPALSRDLGNLALCYLGLGRTREALETFDAALEIVSRLDLVIDEAYWLRGKGAALLRLGDVAQGLELYNRALELYEGVLARASATESETAAAELLEALSEMGEIHLMLGDAASAERQFRRALQYAEKTGHTQGRTINLLELGRVETRRRRWPQAEELLEEAHRLALATGDRGNEAKALLELARLARERARPEEAQARAREALAIARESEARLLEARALYILGTVERETAQPELAAESFSAAAAIVDASGGADLDWRIQHGLGLAWEDLGRTARATAALESAVERIEAVRSQLREPRFAAGYLEQRSEVYSDLIRLLVAQSRGDDAFRVAEKLHARVYLDLFRGGAPPVRDPETRERESELRERVRQLERWIESEVAKSAPEQRQAGLQILGGELAEAERDYERFLDDLRRVAPAWAAVHSLEVPDVGAVRARLGGDEALVEYVVSDAGVVAFVVRNEDLHVVSLPTTRGDLQVRVELLRDLIQARSPEWRLPARALAQRILEPLLEAGWLTGVQRLYIVPHDVLHYAPFAALPVGPAEGVPLIASHELVILPSASLLAADPRPAGTEAGLLALSPARSRLRWAPEEVRRVAEMFRKPRRLLTGRDATEAAFKAEADRFRVVHLATHGRFNKARPLLSGLELEAGGGEDGLLQVHEILDLHLGASLVTLSACNTALGSGFFSEVPSGGDFIGLTGAFLFAGSRAVLASLWEVDDRSAVDLMAGFYRAVEREGSSPATALARVQRELLREEDVAHPYYWAPFMVVGRM